MGSKNGILEAFAKVQAKRLQVFKRYVTLMNLKYSI